MANPHPDPMKYVKPALIVGGSFLGWKFLVAPLLETLGVKDTDEEKLMNKIEQYDVDRDYWSANFYTKAPANHNALIFSTAKANELCAQIEDAKGIFNDDESAIYAAFRQCQYKTQVSYLVYWFNRLYALDLYSWLKDKVLDDKEMRTVLTITEKLPLGFRNLSTNKISGIGAAPVNLFPLIIKQFASEIKGYGIVEVFLNNGEICFTSHYDLPTSLTDSIKDYLITTYPNISGYRWKPNATQRREYAERMREKEAMPIIPVSYAIRVGCFVKFYNVGKGEVVSGTVIKESYGEKTGQHTFTIQSEDGTKTLVKGRNLYPNLLEHIPGDISKQVSR